MTLLRQKAEGHGWRTGSGVDIVAENCVSRPCFRWLLALTWIYVVYLAQFEQTEFWLGLKVPSEARDSIRNVVRKQQ